MTMIKLICANPDCGKEFERPKKEVNRSERKNKPKFCSLSCSCTNSNRVSPRSNIENLKSNNRLDEFSPFRYYVNKANTTERKLSYGNSDLSIQYLKQLWENQKGLCPYTGKEMELPQTTGSHHIKGKPTKASLDRIDSSKGYVQGNVEFVCLAVNLAKKDFTRAQMLDFFHKI